MASVKRERGLTTSGRSLLTLCVLLAGLATGESGLGVEKSRNVILATTTSTQDSGLLDALVPLFEKQTGYRVKTISVGTGQALALAAKGDADVVLVHAPSLEKKYVAAGKLRNRRLVMYNDFVVAGPQEDPAKIRGQRSVVEALKAIERVQAPFVSRGDDSGTHSLETSLWKAADIEPKGSWYIETGQGMGATLRIANERNAYTLTDRGTLLALSQRLTLLVLIEGDGRLLNIYSVLEADPANGPRVNIAGGKAFADFVVARRAQGVIKNFGVERFGRPLFAPAAHQQERNLGG